MKTKKIIDFINKYTIGDVDSVKMVVDANTLSVDALTGKRNCRYYVKMKDTDLDDGEFGIYNSKLLKNILGVLDDDITIKYNKSNSLINALDINDKSMRKATVVTSDLSILDPIKPMKQLPDDFVVVMNITADFIKDFSQSLTALGAENITFPAYSKKDDLSIIFGLMKTSNTNTISLGLKDYMITESTKDTLRNNLTFDGKTLLQILLANKDITGTLSIFDDLMIIDYASDEYENKYLLVALPD